jgi:hypothetical protein
MWVCLIDIETWAVGEVIANTRLSDEEGATKQGLPRQVEHIDNHYG